jgi:hypothetical protein
MNTISAAILGASALMVATVAPGRAQNSEVPSMSQTTRVQSAPAGTGRTVPQLTPLFTIGGVPVYLWAPVEPPYNTHAGQDLATDPLWMAGMATPQSGF